MNKDLIETPRFICSLGDEVLLKGRIVAFDVDENKCVENVVRLEYGQTLNVPNCNIYTKNNIIYELEKVEVPQFVADWIEEARKTCKDVADFFDFDFTNEEVGKWFMQEQPVDLVARAWLDGYEVEEEKRYLVKFKGVYHGDLGYAINFGGYSFYCKERSLSGIRFTHTHKELEEAGFGWVFDCPGIEIEEVE